LKTGQKNVEKTWGKSRVPNAFYIEVQHNYTKVSAQQKVCKQQKTAALLGGRKTITFCSTTLKVGEVKRVVSVFLFHKMKIDSI